MEESTGWVITGVALLACVLGITIVCQMRGTKQDLVIQAERMAAIKAGCSYIDTRYSNKVIICNNK